MALISDQAAALDQMSGTLTSGKMRAGTPRTTRQGSAFGVMPAETLQDTIGDSGGASRFFLTAEPDAPDLPIDELAERFMYCAKAPKSERPTYVKEGGGFGNQNYGGYKTRTCDTCQTRFPATGEQPCGHDGWSWQEQLDRKPDTVSHPTVKPLALMRWLVRLVTPPGGTCLDPFSGSGSTVEAAILEGFDVIAIEREADYLPLIQARIFRAQAKVAAAAESVEPPKKAKGRWPANVALDEESAEALDVQPGGKSVTGPSQRHGLGGRSGGIMGEPVERKGERIGHGDEGGASRFFFVAKSDSPAPTQPEVWRDGAQQPGLFEDDNEGAA